MSSLGERKFTDLKIRELAIIILVRVLCLIKRYTKDINCQVFNLDYFILRYGCFQNYILML